MAEVGFRLTGAASRDAAPLSRDRPRNEAAGFALVAAADAAAIADEWAALSGRAAEDNFFFHPDFVLPAATALGRDVAIATVRASGRMIAVAPVMKARLGRVAPAWRLWAHDYAPLGTPLIDREHVDAAIPALIEGLAGGTSLVLPDMPLDGPAATVARRWALRAGRPLHTLDGHRRALLLRHPEAGVSIRESLPTRRRKEFARQMRRLAEDGRVEIETAASAAEVRARFEEFLALEAAGWKGRGQTALASSEKTAAFAGEVVRRRAASDTARLVSIRLDGTPIAMVICFLEGATAYSWKIAYDERHARYSPGAQLMLEAADSLFADCRIARIDSCAAADHPMIDHLWKDRLAVGTLVIGPVGGSLLHRLGLAAAETELRARAMARRLRARLRQKTSKESAS